jgi:hypothetical protein
MSLTNFNGVPVKNIIGVWRDKIDKNVYGLYRDYVRKVPYFMVSLSIEIENLIETVKWQN